MKFKVYTALSAVFISTFLNMTATRAAEKTYQRSATKKGLIKKKKPQYIAVTQAEYALMEEKRKRRLREQELAQVREQELIQEESEYSQILASDMEPLRPATRAQYNENTSSDPDKFILNIEPIWLLVYGFGAKAEYAVTDKLSVGLTGIYVGEHESEFEDEDTDANAFNWSYQEINLGVNYMLTGQLNTHGFYINPAIGYFRTEITDYGYFYLDGKLESPQLRLTAGYQWVFNDFRIGLGAGGRIYDSSDIIIEDDYGREVATQDSSEWGGLALDLHIGYVF